MGWRDDKRSAILSSLWSSSRLYRSRADSLSLSAISRAVDPGDLTLRRASSSKYGYESWLWGVASFRVPHALVPDSSSCTTGFACTYVAYDTYLPAVSGEQAIAPLLAGGSVADLTFHAIACERLLSDEECVVAIQVNLEIRCNLASYSFAESRREHHFFGAAKQPQSDTGQTSRVRHQAPPPPPGYDDLPLEERLRWILTPPIQELLSDPQLTLPAHPFPYQAYGVRWLMDRESALLADEMGLGKTMQAILAARLLWREQKINQLLIVCPKPLISTWQDEIRKWWPAAAPNTRIAGSNRQFFLKLGTDNVTVKIINYEAIAREAEWLREQSFGHDLIIIDEAQRIKNAESKTAQAVKALNSPRRWALTGTPLENRIDDLVSILEYACPNLIKSAEPDHVRQSMRPFFLRRRAEDVLPELPEKEDQDVPVELESAQRDAYKLAEQQGIVKLNEQGDSITVQHVFALIQRLLQICNWEPVGGASAKLDRISSDLEEVIESGRKVLIFSNFVSEEFGLRRLRNELPSVCRVVEMHGSIPEQQRESAKKAFDTDERINTMLLHYRVGGVGLNLQAASYVYLFDRWWNPAVEDQAVKRAHRVGQHRKVFVRRLYCQGTIEQRILQKLAEKRRLFAQMIDDEDRPEALGLSEEEVFELFPGLVVRPKRMRQPSPVVVLDNLSPSQFEELVARLYEAWGYAASVTGGSRDGGIDVVAQRVAGHGSENVVVQCKHQVAKVGRPELQKLWGVVSDDNTITRGDFVTSSSFSADARAFAKDKRITLIDRDKLLDELRRLGLVSDPASS